MSLLYKTSNYECIEDLMGLKLCNHCATNTTVPVRIINEKKKVDRTDKFSKSISSNKKTILTKNSYNTITTRISTRTTATGTTTT
jgi:hypothetical protein